MTPNQELLLVAAALYLFECLIVLPRQALLFWSPGFRRFKIRTLDGLMGSPAKAAYLAMPLPPLGEYFVAEAWPFTLSPDGVSRDSVHRFSNAVSVAPDGPSYYALDEIRDVAWNGAKILINGQEFASCDCEPSAERSAKLIRKLVDMPISRREATIEKAIDESLDLKKTTDALAAIRKATRFGRMAANALFLVVFAVCPLIAWRRGFANTWPMLGMMLLLFWTMTVWEFWAVHKSLWKDRSRERRKHLFVFGLTPVGAIRLFDAVRRDALASSHPLCVARVTCRDADFQEFAATIYRDLAYPMVPNDIHPTAEEVETTTWFRLQMKSACERFMTVVGMQPAGCVMPPEHIESDCCAYCPRCRTQFTREADECPSCTGVPLRRFDDQLTDDAKPNDTPTPAPTGIEG